MEESTKAFFRKQQEDPDNQVCVDFGTATPQWASVSHGCYISLESSGVHRSLGVHISFVRSTTMDSWKPSQLKLMEMGGNKKLRAFFREHNIPDETPIVQKYNTRAAEWYRKHLRALAEGTEPPPPLPEGTGHLPAVANEPAIPQVPFANGNGALSAGGALPSDARHCETRGYPGSGGGYHAGGGYHGADSGHSPAASSTSIRRQPEEHSRSEQDIFSSILGNEVGTKVSSGLWGTMGVVRSFASKAKEAMEDKVKQAQDDGWMDTAVATAKHVGEATKKTATYVQEGGGREVLTKTTEKLGDVARQSISTVSSGADWVAEHLAGARGNANAAGLQAMSSGSMQGFGSDSFPSSASSASAAPEARGVAATQQARRSYHEDIPPAPTPQAASAPAVVSSVPAPAPTAADTAEVERIAAERERAKEALWNDDDWGDWK